MVNKPENLIDWMATMWTTAVAIAPMVYIQLLIATIISVFIFGDPIDRTAIMGGLLIIFGELLLWCSECTSAPVIAA